jgi:hypothetical protein
MLRRRQENFCPSRPHERQVFDRARSVNSIAISLAIDSRGLCCSLSPRSFALFVNANDALPLGSWQDAHQLVPPQAISWRVYFDLVQARG